MLSSTGSYLPTQIIKSLAHSNLLFLSRKNSFQIMADLQLDVPMLPREEDNWCWASCAQMLSAYYNINSLKQCNFADFISEEIECCKNSTKCNFSANPTQINRLYKWLSIYFDFNNSVMSFKNLEYQIRQGCPVQVSWSLNRGGGHVLLVIGTGIGSQGEYVHINDPHSGYRRLSYKSLLDAAGLGEWDYTWWNLESLGR